MSQMQWMAAHNGLIGTLSFYQKQVSQRHWIPVFEAYCDRDHEEHQSRTSARNKDKHAKLNDEWVWQTLMVLALIHILLEREQQAVKDRLDDMMARRHVWLQEPSGALLKEASQVVTTFGEPGPHRTASKHYLQYNAQSKHQINVEFRVIFNTNKSRNNFL